MRMDDFKYLEECLVENYTSDITDIRLGRNIINPNAIQLYDGQFFDLYKLNNTFYVVGVELREMFDLVNILDILRERGV